MARYSERVVPRIEDVRVVPCIEEDNIEDVSEWCHVLKMLEGLNQCEPIV